jgi:heme A synthase
MTTDNDVAVHLGQPTVPDDRSHRLRRWWIAITTLLALAFLFEAIFAGAMLSGVDWARKAHAANAIVLLASSIAASLAAVVTLRRIPQGPRFALSLLSMAVLVFVQAGVGTLSAKGANLLWVHVPLGAALLSFATQTAFRASKLGRNDL